MTAAHPGPAGTLSKTKKTRCQQAVRETLK